jgi:signal transduction histidine kinase
MQFLVTISPSTVKAQWVDISFSNNRGRIELVILDDGVDIDLDLIFQTSIAKSLGLTSMRERAELTGACQSSPLPVKVQLSEPSGQLKQRISFRKTT